jgi:hypothetical protein
MAGGVAALASFQLGGWHTRCELRHDDASTARSCLRPSPMRARNASRPIGLVRTWVPTLAVETAQQGRQLRTKIHYLVTAEAVT